MFPGFVGAGLAPAQGNRKGCLYTQDCFASLAMTFCGRFIRFLVLFSSWTRTEIEKRAEALAEQALRIWSYFGQENTGSSGLKEITGTTPTELKILGQQFQVQTWRDILEQTLNTVADLEPEKFKIIANNFPRYLGKDKNKFRTSRRLQNGYFIEVNLSAQSIQKFCYQAMETIELTFEDWSVSVTVS